MTYEDNRCIICGEKYLPENQVYGDGFCDDCMIDGDDELQIILDRWRDDLATDRWRDDLAAGRTK